MQRGSDLCDGHFLAFCHIACATHDIENLFAHVHFAEAKAVGVGVGLHRSDVTDHDTCQSSRHVLNVFHTFHFQTCCGQHLGGLVDRNVEGKELLKPAGRNLHGCLVGNQMVLANLLCSSAFSVGENRLHLHPSIGM